jgi:hypothetical protein
LRIGTRVERALTLTTRRMVGRKYGSAKSGRKDAGKKFT